MNNHLGFRIPIKICMTIFKNISLRSFNQALKHNYLYFRRVTSFHANFIIIIKKRLFPSNQNSIIIYTKFTYRCWRYRNCWLRSTTCTTIFFWTRKIIAVQRMPWFLIKTDRIGWCEFLANVTYATSGRNNKVKTIKK